MGGWYRHSVPSTTGAFSETSRFVVDNISKFVEKNKKQVIIEYGAGHGNITKGILDKMNEDSVLYAFEIHTDFCKQLEQIKDKRLRIKSSTIDQIMRIKINSPNVGNLDFYKQAMRIFETL